MHDLTTQRTAAERPNSYFTIVNPKNGEEFPANKNATWRITKDSIKTYIKENRIVFPGDYPFLKIKRPVLRYWKEDDMRKAGSSFGQIAVSTKLPDDVGMSKDGTQEISSLFNGKIFSFPKPIGLIKHLISIVNDKEAIVLDFFSGSATTAHAVMRLNAEDGGKRKFIMAQLPEPTAKDSEARKAGYKTICDIGEERMRRAGKQMHNEQTQKQPGLFGNADEAAAIDTGFRVFRVDTSNMRDVSRTPADTDQQQLDLFADNIKPDRTEMDLLFDSMLRCELPLSAHVKVIAVGGERVYSADGGKLVACFAKPVTQAIIAAMAAENPEMLLFRDDCFERDEQKINIVEQLKQLLSWDDSEALGKIRVI